MPKWFCRPGKNRCDVGEEETTAGANALNLVPLPLPGTANASIGVLPDANVIAPVTGAVQSNSVPVQLSKKKKEPREGTDLTNPPKKREKASLKGNLETTSYGSGGLGIESMSADFTAEKHKSKHQNLGRYSDGGLLPYPFWPLTVSQPTSKKIVQIKSSPVSVFIFLS